MGDRQVDLRLALIRIRHVLRADRVIVDSGATLNATVLRQGLVDIVDVVTLPGLVGGLGTPSVMDGRPLESHELPIRLQLLDSRVDQGAVPTRWRVVTTER